MRYYSIEIRNKDGEIIRPIGWDKLGLETSYTSYVNGATLPGALNVELDIPTAPMAMPKQGAYVKIWGVSIGEISQANDLSGCGITIYAGMKKGLPLAKPQQSVAPLVEGQIYQAFGNREGTLQSLDLVLQPSVGTLARPVNLILDWAANTPLAGALRTTLSNGLKDFQLEIAISSDLKLPGTQVGNYPTLQTLASEIKLLSQDSLFRGIKPLGGGPYTGVDIYVKGKKIYVVDGTQNVGLPTFDTPTQILFEDLMGQPTWIGPNVINVRTVMRSDLGVNDYVKLPDNLRSPYVITTPAAAFSNVPSRSQSTFKGKFWIREAHSYGNFRQPGGTSWVTSFNMLAVPQPNDPTDAATWRGS